MPLLLEQKDDHTEARLQGELTIFNIEEYQDELLNLLNHKEITLDLSELHELDGCGAQMLVILQIEAQRTGKRITLIANNPVVEHTMQCLGISTVHPNKGH
ncbi:MAG: STAS domain-containing protein [Proteobacteria bacterium]|nr:STAS domain-containing protein [Pseudomonadota bacterium]